MAWGKDGGQQGPWGRPSGGNTSGPGGRGKGPLPPQPPDFDAFFRKGQDRFRRVFGGDGGNKRSLALFFAALALL